MGACANQFETINSAPVSGDPVSGEEKITKYDGRWTMGMIACRPWSPATHVAGIADGDLMSPLLNISTNFLNYKREYKPVISLGRYWWLYYTFKSL